VNDWQERKRVELTAKLSSLETDVGQWSGRSRPGQELEKHHSQLLRLERDFLPVAGRLATDAASATAGWRDVERAVHDLLSVWGYFRDKLALRLVPQYAGYLAAADDFAWACYQPMQRAAVEAGTVELDAVREPPLTCLDDVASPFSLVRGTSYEGEMAATERLVESSRVLMRRLPIPVIAVPWFQLQHLPDALVIAHEVGHHVVRDLGLEGTAADAVRGEPGAGFPGTWTVEAFCDVFGALCAGASFARSLADFLRVADVADDATDLYPPTQTRLALCLAVLDLQDGGAGDASRVVRGQWEAEGLVVPDDVCTRAAAVTTAVATSCYPQLGGRLLDVVSFDRAKETRKELEATELLAHRPTTTKDVRVLLSAAAAAFARDPELYRRVDVGGRVLESARAIREPGVRWRAGHLGDDDDDGATSRLAEAEVIYDLLTRERTGAMP
jgi:hypothetical protein